jgi:hypothetical protein
VPDPVRGPIIRSVFDKFSQTGSVKAAFKLALESGLTTPSTKQPVSFSTLGYLLRNPVYSGVFLWSGKLYQGNHKPLVSKELFEQVKGSLKHKVRKKRTYKTFLLSGKLVKCTECASTMTPTFTNKKEGRYHYYKCMKVIKIGKDACSIKHVRAEWLEDFVIESLSKTATDQQFIENYALKRAHLNARHLGLELFEVWSKFYENGISETLQTFKSDIQKATTVDRVGVIKRYIKRIDLNLASLNITLPLKTAHTAKFPSVFASQAAGGRPTTDSPDTALLTLSTPVSTALNTLKNKNGRRIAATAALVGMAPRVGLEPTTRRLTVACSTN